MLASGSKRPRASHDSVSDIASVLKEYIGVPTKISPYGPNQHVPSLKKHRQFILKIGEVSANLSVAPLAMKAALEKVAVENQSLGKFSDKDTLEFASAQGPRIRMMCRHVAQARTKKVSPTWLKGFNDTSQLTTDEVRLNLSSVNALVCTWGVLFVFC